MTDRGPRWVHAVSLPASDAYQQSGWRPPADVYRLPDGWLIKMELAGVRADQIRIQARGHVLSVSGVRRDLAIAESQTCYSMEISYNRFHRSFELPNDIERASVATEYRDGMLLIRIKVTKEQE